ncbi:MAG: 6-carboxytetrahydropterin synthase [Cyanobacteria bacterium P01_F01_bin.153]
MVCSITRRASFSASYYYRLPELSQEENEARFGIQARSPGATFWLWVKIIGPVDEYGMVANLSTQVKRSLRRYILKPLNGRNLNETWVEFAETLPTPEWISHTLWHRLKPHLNVASIVVSPHEEVRAEYLGNGMEARLTIRTHFSAAHRLSLPRLTLVQNSEIYGKCSRPSGHGHNYNLAVTIQGEIDPKSGMVVDFKELTDLIENGIIKELDHRFLNTDIPYFDKVVPTAENIAIYIRDSLENPIKNLGATLYKIELHETDNNSCEVYGNSVIEAQMESQNLGQLTQDLASTTAPSSNSHPASV